MRPAAAAQWPDANAGHVLRVGVSIGVQRQGRFEIGTATRYFSGMEPRTLSKRRA